MTEEQPKEQQKTQVDAEAQRIRFIQERFKKYYQKTELSVTDMPQREFAFMFFGKPGMVRHISFTPAALNKFIVERVPAHIYYSSALYRKPDARTMDEKGWLGADLIFDLDADHIPGSENMNYPEMLANVKEEFKKLVDDFLLNDFGFGEEDVKIVFSGGRGYHAHITKDCVRKLGPSERREIVDYISGTGLIDSEKIEGIRECMRYLMDVEDYIPGGANAKTKFPQKRKLSIWLPPPHSMGWKKKMREGILATIREWETKDISEVRKIFEGKKKGGKKVDGVMRIGATKAEKLCTELYVERKARIIAESGNLSVLSWIAQESLFKYVAQKLAPAISGETDEPVTSDIKRLIRLPNTLHGKTGLVVKEMTRQEFGEFDPLRDAVPEIYTDAPVKVEITKAEPVTLKGEQFCLDNGVTEVPEFVAMFLLCRGMAKLVGSGNT
ncbi:MAG: DNA primase small subunit PriS [Thermoplasmata archaeon]|nr:DNA primase small subunit PriS [Thermoplasmata archaeon]